MKPGGGSSLQGPAGSPVVAVVAVVALSVVLALAVAVALSVALVGPLLVPVAVSLTLPSVAVAVALPVGVLSPVVGVVVVVCGVVSVAVALPASPGRPSSPQALHTAVQKVRYERRVKDMRETRATSPRYHGVLARRRTHTAAWRVTIDRMPPRTAAGSGMLAVLEARSCDGSSSGVWCSAGAW